MINQCDMVKDCKNIRRAWKLTDMPVLIPNYLKRGKNQLVIPWDVPEKHRSRQWQMLYRTLEKLPYAICLS